MEYMDIGPKIVRWVGDELTKAQVAANRFEAGTIFILLVIASWPAFSFTLSVLVPLLHGLFLFCAFLLVRHYLAKLRPLAGQIFFACCVSVIAIEIAIHHFTSLHLNRFVLSLAFQPQAGEQIGLSKSLLYQLALLAALAYLAARFLPWRLHLATGKLVLVLLVSLVAAQTLNGFLMYQRDTGLLGKQRHFVFFAGLHHYHAELIFTPLFGARPQNPFARSFNGTTKARTTDTSWAISNPRNLLLVVVDSTRASDIRSDASVAPNLARLGEKGFLSLDHSSVANCTHFGMHTLLSGHLATSFGQARHSGTTHGFLAALSESGYSISTAESQSLDWYDLAGTYLPGAARVIAAEGSNAERDKAVAAQTVKRLEDVGTGPWAHLAYFSGPHFSYDERHLSSLKAYRAAITHTDQLIGQMLETLAARGALDDTLVIITSDHGEDIGDDGTIGHGSILNDAQTKVPLLILGATVPTDWITSHRDILPFVRAELGAGPLRALPAETQILTGCDYEFPKSFAYIDENGRVDFLLQDGLLSPTPSPDGAQPTEAQIKHAGLKLIQLLNQ